jgi:small-conductance mechanosensitive channel
MKMKSNYTKKSRLLVVFLLVIFSANYAMSQIQLLDKITGKTALNDSLVSKNEINIENVNKEIEFTDNLLLKRKLSEFSENEQLKLHQMIDTFEIYLEQQGKEFREFTSNKVWRYYLVNARINWREYDDQLGIFQIQLQKVIRDLQKQQNYYILNHTKWENSIPALEKNLSPLISGYIKSNQDQLNQIIHHYDGKITELVTSENNLVQNAGYVESILNEINGLIDKRRTELFKQNEPVIFDTQFKGSYSGSLFSRFQLAYYENTKTFDYFFLSIRNHYFWNTFLIVLMMLFFLYIRKKFIGLNHDESSADYLYIRRIMIEMPILTLFTIVTILWTILTPYSPFLLNLILYLAALVLLRIILSPVIDPIIKNVSLLLIIMLAVTNLEVFAWYFGNYSRIYLLLEAFLGIILVLRFIYPLLKAKQFQNQRKNSIFYTRIIAFSILVLNIISLIANVAGYENLAGYSLKLSVYTGVTTVVALGLQRIIFTFIQTTIYVLNINYSNIVIRYGDDILKRSRFILNILIGYFWVSGILHIAELWDNVSSKFSNVFTNQVVIGSVSFSLGKILLFLAILYFTYVTASLIKQIFEREVLARYKLKRGIAASVSLTIRIFLVFFGTLIALSVSGMDLGKIGIFAGALSVGIGFGLQNIVSNFISGLILIYEKPVQEGDTVEVDTLLGRVSNIGIRSSTISTYDGAEVVVPNSNLISNQLINWTLSDNKKRIEVKVGTAYGSDPNKVIELLLKAALAHDKVLKEPEPRPFFTGFGDSSLNFRLLFWVRFEDGLQTQSDVAINIYNLFKVNNIEIPFPQIDLHIRSGAES